MTDPLSPGLDRELFGDDNELFGGENELSVEDSERSGDDNELPGDDNGCSGDDQELSGDDNEHSGDDNELSGDDNELFEDCVDLNLHQSFDMYAMQDPKAASSNSIEPSANHSNGFWAANINGVTLSDIERPEKLQTSEWAPATIQQSTEDLSGDIFSEFFAGNVEASEGEDNIFNWACVDTTEHPEGLPDVDWPTPPASSGSESLQAGSGEKGSAVDPGNEVLVGSLSREEMDTILRLRALAPPQNAGLAPVQTPAVQPTPAVEEDPVNSQFDKLIAQCNTPVQISPVSTFVDPNFMAPMCTSDQMPQVSRQHSFHQSQQGAQIELGNHTYMAVSNNGINSMSPPQFPNSSPAASSNASASSPTPSKAPKRTPTKRAPAKRAPAKSTTAAGSRVTKKKTHQRNTSAPSSSPTPPGRRRSMQELYDAQFVTLTKEEKARLLLPLLQGIDPMTGLPTGRPGMLGIASSLSAFNQGTNSLNASPTMSMNNNIGAGNVMGMGMGNNIGMGMGNNAGMPMGNNGSMAMGNNTGIAMDNNGNMFMGNNAGMPMSDNPGMSMGSNAGMAMSTNGSMPMGNYAGMTMVNNAGMPMGNNTGMPMGNNAGMPMVNNAGMPMGNNAGMDMRMGNNICMSMGNGFNQDMNNYMGMNGGGFNMDNGAGLGNNFNMKAFNMAQQAAADLNNHDYGMMRQNEALERAAMLQAAGRRR